MKFFDCVAFVFFSTQKSPTTHFKSARTVMRWMVSVLLGLTGLASTAQALLINQDSAFGSNSMTLDTDTGLAWLDPYLSLNPEQGSAGCCTSYNEVLGRLTNDSRYEGFRYATRSELETLFYSSAGFDPITSSSSQTATDADKVAAGYLQSYVDTTNGWGSKAYDDWSAVTHGYFDDENPDEAIGSAYFFYGVQGSNLLGGNITFYSEPNPNLNADPIGHWLVRDSTISVDEPSSLSLLAISFAGMYGVIRQRRRKAAELTSFL